MAYTCYYGVQLEFLNGSFYFNLYDNFLGWLYVVTVQDQRVYQDLSGIWNQYSIGNVKSLWDFIFGTRVNFQ